MNPDMDYMKTALHGVGNRLNELKGKAVQGDYQQNNPTAPDYIKNRPGGYTVKTEETVTATYESRPGDISCNEASAAGASLRNVLIADFSEDILNAVLNNTLLCTAGKSAEKLNGMEWTQAGTFYYKQIAFESQYGQKIPTIVLATTAGEKFLGDAQYNVAGLYVFDQKLASQADYEAIVVTAVEWPRIKFEDIKIPEKYLPEKTSDIVILDSFRGHSYEDLIPLVQSGKLPFIKGGLADSLYRLHFCSSQTIEFSYIYIEDQQTVIDVQTSNPGSPSWTSSTYKSAGASAVIVKGAKSTAGQITLNKTYFELVTLARKNIPLFVKLEGSTQWFQLFHNDTAYGTLVFFGYDNRNGLAILRVRSDDSITYTNTPVLSPSAKTDDQTQEVGMDSDGMLWTKPADTSLGLTGATVGQIAKITAVDASGVPTAWSPVDMAGGEKPIAKIIDTEITEKTGRFEVNNLQGVSTIVAIWSGIFNETGTDSGLNLQINDVTIATYGFIKNAKKDSKRYGYSVAKLVNGFWVCDISPGATAKNNVSPGPGFNQVFNIVEGVGAASKIAFNASAAAYVPISGRLEVWAR